MCFSDFEENPPKFHEASKIEFRSQIILFHMAGLRISEISRRLRVSRNTIRKWVLRYTKEETLNSRPRSGRPRISTEEQDNLLIKCYEKNPKSSVSAIVRNLNLPIGPTAARKRLNEHGIQLPVTGRALKSKELNQLIKFCKDHKYV